MASTHYLTVEQAAEISLTDLEAFEDGAELEHRKWARTGELSPSSDDPELAVLDDVQLRRLTGDGLVRYSQRGRVQLEQARTEALRRLDRRVLKAKLDEKNRLHLEG